LVRPGGALKEVSDYLDAMFHRVRRGDITIDDVVAYDAAEGAVSFHLPELAAILARHEEATELASKMKPDWAASRPAYSPVSASAPGASASP
jgi:hypothetical protein